MLTSSQLSDWYDSQNSALFTKEAVDFVVKPHGVVIEATEFGDVLCAYSRHMPIFSSFPMFSLPRYSCLPHVCSQYLPHLCSQYSPCLVLRSYVLFAHPILCRRCTSPILHPKYSMLTKYFGLCSHPICPLFSPHLSSALTPTAPIYLPCSYHLQYSVLTPS